MSPPETERPALRVGIVGCGLVGNKRAAALGQDELVACFDLDTAATQSLADRFGGSACRSLVELLANQLDVVIVALPHDQLAEHACLALERLGARPRREARGHRRRRRRADRACGRGARRRVKVGFNHRFHPGTARAIAEARSESFGPVLHVRARYGHGGRLGYEKEWRASRAISGGGEFVDQGMHLFDLSHSIVGPLPAQLGPPAHGVLADGGRGQRRDHARRPDHGPWTMFHASWTEWKNLFSLEIFCRSAKLQVDGLAGSYGPQRLTIYSMRPELGPPDVETIEFPADDESWNKEWQEFAEAVHGADGRALAGDLDSAAYGWRCIEAAYARTGDG